MTAAVNEAIWKYEKYKIAIWWEWLFWYGNWTIFFAAGWNYSPLHLQGFPYRSGGGGGLNFVKRDEIQQKGEFNILGMSGESPPQSLPWLQILIFHIMNPLRSVLGLITVIILKRVTE